MITADLLTEGAHTLYIRSLDMLGDWSITHGISLLVLDIKADETSKIIALEYFIDNDPGFFMATPVNISPAAESVDRKFFIPTADLSDGPHTLYVRAIDENGSWSITQRNVFAKISVDKRKPDIVFIEYFIDEDPGFGKGKIVTTSPDINIDKIFNVDLSDVVTEADLNNPIYESQHTLYIRALAEDGEWSVTQYTIDLKVSNIPPVDQGDQPYGGAVLPVYTEVCQDRVSTIDLRATGFSRRVGNWESRIIYEDGTSSNWTTVPNSTGVELLQVSPNIAGSWQYRAMIYDGDRGPEPSMPATVKIISAALGGKVTASVPEYLCSGKDFTLTLEESRGDIVRWQMRNTSTAEDAQWINIDESTAQITVTPNEGGIWEYRAEVAMGDCSNEFSASLKVNVISSTTGGLITPATLTACIGKSFELTAYDYLGGIVQWQYSNDGGNTWNTILPLNATNNFSVTPISTGVIYYRIMVIAGNCDPTYSLPAIVTVLDGIGAAQDIVGPEMVCLPSDNVRYSIPAITGVDYYEWTLPAGAVFVGESNRNEVYVYFGEASVSGLITVRGVSNICGAGEASSKYIELSSRPETGQIYRLPNNY